MRRKLSGRAETPEKEKTEEHWPLPSNENVCSPLQR
jgi:hypothetical protein